MKFLLSCISTNHSTLKKHWSDTGQDTACPLTVLGSLQKPKEDLGGQLCLIDDQAGVLNTMPLPMAAGLAPSEHGLFVTTFSAIHEADLALQTLHQDVITSPLFNALHSISRTRAGYLVASTGLDLVIELNANGDILWSWWATDHGFTHTPTGEYRQLDKQADHRAMKYGTLQQTTHVNSVAELPDGRVLATLFHQGSVIAIDRDTGNWQTLLEGLDHPHSIRVLDEEHFTVADTVNGHALLARFNATSTRAQVEETIDATTNWLQDASYNGAHDAWLLVDGKQSQIQIRGGRSGKQMQAQIGVDPEWRLYEAYALS
ncbi:MAG TPA: hypothetical protein VHZ51_31810 [Ktedonobacteraceae bacterium]|jgi:hypothetical protein|nr:hypothetical protein [Ktedonobacteraceae bacterium]